MTLQLTLHELTDVPITLTQARLARILDWTVWTLMVGAVASIMSPGNRTG